jgi:K+-transporting ATPase ATPase C chain
MLRELKSGFLLMLVMTILLGLIYPTVVTGIAQALFRDQADGSLVIADGEVIGSRLVGQPFSRPEYFRPRPSSAGAGYDAASSAGSNLGPTSARLLNGAITSDANGVQTVAFDGIKTRVVHYCVDNDLPFESSRPLDGFKRPDGSLDDVKLIQAFNDSASPLVFRSKAPVPPDAVSGSASGLDPDISPANAAIQAPRVAGARGLEVDQVLALVAKHTRGRTFGLLGEPTVNVLLLNLDLDAQATGR